MEPELRAERLTTNGEIEHSPKRDDLCLAFLTRYLMKQPIVGIAPLRDEAHVAILGIESQLRIEMSKHELDL